MAQRWIVIPKWDGADGFQHYKDRDPIWIKAYTRLLSDRAFLELSMHLRGILISMWLEYARSNRQLSDSTVGLSRQLGQRVMTRDLERLNHAGFIAFSASKPLAPVYSGASPEKSKSKNPLPPTGKTFCDECGRDYRSVEDLDAHRFRIHSKPHTPIEEGT